jgi:uncharacterized repeat protein (TIGR02543 family)
LGVVVESNPAVFEVSAPTIYTVNYIANISNVNIVSPISFTYAGAEVVSNDGVYTIEVATKDGVLQTVTPVAVGYTFLGWAKDEDGVTFTTMDDPSITYYAVWASNNVNYTVQIATQGNALPVANADGYVFLGYSNGSGFVNSASDVVLLPIWGTSNIGSTFTAEVNYEGVTPSAPDGSGCTLNGLWYTDSSFATVLQDITSDEDGILYVRAQFTLTYKLTGNSMIKITDTYLNKTQTVKDFSNSVTVLEGQKIVATRSSDTYSVTITADDEEITTMTITKAIVKRYYFHESGYTTESVSEDITYKFTY